MKEKVREYYGKTIKSNNDLKTSACCAIDSIPPHARDVLKEIDTEILEKFYGCGSPIPYALNGSVVLDLGSGTGRDVYVASKLVGKNGKVIGVDMTDEQLDIARKHLSLQMEKFGFSEPNVEFRKGYIEDLKSIGIEDNSMDIVISNCVINLSQNKRSVFSEIFRVLKEGGELYFSDVFADRRIPVHLQNDPVFVGECLGGALYIEDFRRMLREFGCHDYRVVKKRRLILEDPEIKKMAGDIVFCSMTIRAFKLNTLEDICEDYGLTAKYLGTIKGSRDEFVLDDHHTFKTGESVMVCGNTASMLGDTRYKDHFEITGNRSVHFGRFPCEPTETKGNSWISGSGCC